MAHDNIEDLIASLALKGSFWAICISKLPKKIIQEKDVICAVSIDNDGQMFFQYNFDLLNLFSDDDINAFLQHEIEHLFNNHFTRYKFLTDGDDVNKELFQIAADMAINPNNNKLKNKYIINGVEYITIQPELYGFENGLLLEDYYNKLKEQSNKSESKNSENNENSNDNNSESENNENLSDKSKSKDSESNQSKESKNKKQSLNNRYIAPNNHSNWDVKIDDPISTYILENNVRCLIQQSLEEYHQSFGLLDSYTEAQLADFIKTPKLPYYEIIKHHIKGSILAKYKTSYSKCNKKRMYMFDKKFKNIIKILPFPGKTHHKSFKIGILLDTSASIPITDDGIYEALSGIDNLIKNDRYARLTLIQNDTKIVEEKEIKKARDIKRIVIKGRGGTNLLPGLHRFKELKHDVVIVFTDGYFEDLSKYVYSLPKKIIWVLPSENSSTNNIGDIGVIVKFPVNKNKGY